MADTIPPPLTDADLANLTYEQLAALINEGNPNDFYNEAIAFDEASGRLRQLIDDFQRESRTLQDFVSGEIEAALEQVTQKHAAWIDSVLQAMTNPGYAQALRNAGDALAAGQQRLRDQQTATAQAAAPPPPEQGEQTRQQALRILLDIGTAYRDVGGMFTPLPDNYRDPKQSFSNGPGGGEAGPGNGAPGPGYGTQYVGGRFLTENSYFHTDSAVGPSELVTGGPPGAVAPGGGVFAASATGGGGAFVNALGRSDSTVDFVPAQELAVTDASAGGPPPVMAAGMLAPGVLGRPAAKNKSERKVTTTTTEEPELLLAESGERPETESTTPKHEVAIPAVQPVTASVPATAGLPATAGVPATAGLPATASAGSPVPPVKHALSAPAFDLRADFGASRGVAAPPSFREVTTELAAVTDQRSAAAMTTPATPAQNPATSGPSMPMMPMGMGMGGMRGGAGQENNERFADVPVPPEAEVWNPVGSGGAVLGRPERGRSPEPSASSDPCPEQGDVEAAKLAAMQAILGKTERS